MRATIAMRETRIPRHPRFVKTDALIMAWMDVSIRIARCETRLEMGSDNPLAPYADQYAITHRLRPAQAEIETELHRRRYGYSEGKWTR